VLIAALGLGGCGSVNESAGNGTLQAGHKSDTAQKNTLQAGHKSNTAQKKNVPLFTGEGGKGMVIAVPAPALQNSTKADAWMPQLFQDIITGDLARYSAMTVLDRSNEQIVLAEQSLSASGSYSEDDYIRIGNLTNARYIVAGTIMNVSGSYTIAFRVNNTETNEIQTSFNNRYSVADIENGLAAKETVRALIAGLGIELTEAGEEALLTIPEVEVKATAQLAKGMAAEKNDDLVEALAFYTEATTIDSGMKEAAVRIETFGNTVQTSNIRERTEQGQREKEKWNKIFRDLKTYITNNLPIVVYDFSNVKDTINVRSSTVSFEITRGVKFVPNRTVLVVWKTVWDNWGRIKNLEENKFWASAVSHPDMYSSAIALKCDVEIGVYDEYGDKIGTGHLGGNISFYYEARSYQVVAQHKYYEEQRFVAVYCTNIPVNMLTDTVNFKIDRVYYREPRENITPPILTVSEWEEWLKTQQGK
jgi:hypothetical protein